MPPPTNPSEALPAPAPPPFHPQLPPPSASKPLPPPSPSTSLTNPNPTTTTITTTTTPTQPTITTTPTITPANTAKRPSPAFAKPPSTHKRPRKPNWYDTIRDAWNLLRTRCPHRHQFTIHEIVDLVNSQWLTLRGTERRPPRWRKELQRFVRKENVLTKSHDKSDEFYVVRDLNYQPALNKKKDAPEKKKFLSDDDPTLSEHPLFRATVPIEWTTELFKPVRLSTFDKSPAIQFISTPPSNTVKGCKGYRMVRATAGVCEGEWYFEATMLPYKGDGAVRLGWCQRRSDPETPVGFDSYGFGFRNRTGEFIHAARLKPYGEPFHVGDVIGCAIHLPSLKPEEKQKIKEADEKWLRHRFVNLLQGQAPADSGIDVFAKLRVRFFKNGQDLGIPAFFTDKDVRDVHAPRKTPDDKVASGLVSKTNAPSKRQVRAGYYYPAVSIYGNAVVHANFGPDFASPLPGGYRPMCEAAREEPVAEAVDHVVGEKEALNTDINPKQKQNDATDTEACPKQGDEDAAGVVVDASCAASVQKTTSIPVEVQSVEECGALKDLMIFQSIN